MVSTQTMRLGTNDYADLLRKLLTSLSRGFKVLFMSNDIRNEIADTIICQLVGNPRFLQAYARLIAMTGAHAFAIGSTLVTFKFKGCKEFNLCTIELEGDDTYRIRLSKWDSRRFAEGNVTNLFGVMADNLKATFTRLTGLDTNL